MLKFCKDQNKNSPIRKTHTCDILHCIVSPTTDVINNLQHLRYPPAGKSLIEIAMTQACDATHPVRLSYSAESAAIQQCFSLTINQRAVLSATINQRNEHADGSWTSLTGRV
jgi:hypothetical protein